MFNNSSIVAKNGSDRDGFRALTRVKIAENIKIQMNNEKIYAYRRPRK